MGIAWGVPKRCDDKLITPAELIGTPGVADFTMSKAKMVSPPAASLLAAILLE